MAAGCPGFRKAVTVKEFEEIIFRYVDNCHHAGVHVHSSKVLGYANNIALRHQLPKNLSITYRSLLSLLKTKYFVRRSYRRVMRLDGTGTNLDRFLE